MRNQKNELKQFLISVKTEFSNSSLLIRLTKSANKAIVRVTVFCHKTKKFYHRIKTIVLRLTVAISIALSVLEYNPGQGSEKFISLIAGDQNSLSRVVNDPKIRSNDNLDLELKMFEQSEDIILVKNSKKSPQSQLTDAEVLDKLLKKVDSIPIDWGNKVGFTEQMPIHKTNDPKLVKNIIDKSKFSTYPNVVGIEETIHTRRLRASRAPNLHPSINKRLFSTEFSDFVFQLAKIRAQGQRFNPVIIRDQTSSRVKLPVGETASNEFAFVDCYVKTNCNMLISQLTYAVGVALTIYGYDKIMVKLDMDEKRVLTLTRQIQTIKNELYLVKKA